VPPPRAPSRRSGHRGPGAREQQEQAVGVARLEQAHQRGIARRPRLAARKTDLEHAPRAEQDRIGGRPAHVLPVPGTFDEVHLALGEAGGTRTRANRIGRLAREQRFVAGDEVGGRQALASCGASESRELQIDPGAALGVSEDPIINYIGAKLPLPEGR
jgi:hypothetical protein